MEKLLITGEMRSGTTFLANCEQPAGRFTRIENARFRLGQAIANPDRANIAEEESPCDVLAINDPYLRVRYPRRRPLPL